jgi:hypothetical protein
LKNLPIAVLLIFLCGCTNIFVNERVHSSTPPEQSVQQPSNICPGTVELPDEFVPLFDPVEDEALLNSALGEPDKGMLCQGKVYKVKQDVGVILYRAWNSTNPNSRLGTWWTFYRPAGKTALFRSDFEICYQWSPLDKLTRCNLKAGTEVVVGTGQSAECSQYLTYPASAAQQIYIENASSTVSNCSDYDALFNWVPVGQ